ncbi:MFS transporter [Echinicola jeungdonensis]|uniref:MFS transporter n=1 Tax=Echinicola jeungdonensis TaxID=709343 RepID=A0ABV5J036_9BACT|nr:MFS transporter [Echinicola jeungdonensis]MDN3669204.1 MFS transporter [Echinicola jeungdonensis]
MPSKKYVLPIIVISQFCCTSLWFAGNGVMPYLVDYFQLGTGALAHLTSAVQLGFITGTLIFALLTIADRFRPSRVFFISALLGATINLGTLWEGNTMFSLLAIRFLTGFFLAGIYPVGMKIAADYFNKTLGSSLGLLVGALVLGTAFPHFLAGFSGSIPWEWVLILTSLLSLAGGLLMVLIVPDGPYRKPSPTLDLTAFFQVFSKDQFRSAAFGYFGHMWELFSFWAFIPVILRTYSSSHPDAQFKISLLSFSIIGIGGLACVISGYLSQSLGTKKVASTALGLSGLCCLLSPLMFKVHSPLALILFLLFWGMMVVADSPLFSTLVAQNASSSIKGTALTIVNSIGFAITIISIQLINLLQHSLNPHYLYLVLALGPGLGLIALYSKND